MVTLVEPPSIVEQARQIPLESILAYHGLKPRREGSTTRYKNDGYNIVVSGKELWFDNAASVGGRGPIDLILHLKYKANPRRASDRDLREAIVWLAKFNPSTPLVRADGAAVSPSPQPPKESFASKTARLAIRDDARWPLARSYLLDTRRLPSDLIDQLYHQGDIYASFSEKLPEQTGVCFLHRNLAGEPRGATIRTASDGPGFPLSIGEKQGAWFTLGDPAQANRAVLVEAPIDAISYTALKRRKEPLVLEETVVLAMSCSHVFRSVLQAAHERLWPLTVGFDNDKAGNTGWERCREDQHFLYPDDLPARRIVPAGKDWNDDLQAAPRLSRGRHP